MGGFSLSVCMIVKNEEKVLSRCLSCVKQFADEIIIVDTGSEDLTKQIALSFTDKVYDFVWCNDFSKARNFSIMKATKEYFMWLDADDVITKDNIEKIINLKKRTPTADVFYLKYIAGFDGANKPIFSFFRERILKNNNTFYFSGFVHEAISPHGRTENLEIEVEHRKESCGDKMRNLRLYRSRKRSGCVFSSREQYYYSKELYYNHYYSSTLIELKKFLKMENIFYPNKVDAVLTIGRVLNHKGKHLEAKQFLTDSFKNICPTSEILCEIGFAAVYDENLEEAITFFEQAMNVKQNESSGIFFENDYYYMIPSLALCSLFYQLGNLEKSRFYHEKAKEIDKDNPSVVFNEQFFK